MNISSTYGSHTKKHTCMYTDTHTNKHTHKRTHTHTHTPHTHTTHTNTHTYKHSHTQCIVKTCTASCVLLYLEPDIPLLLVGPLFPKTAVDSIHPKHQFPVSSGSHLHGLRDTKTPWKK